VCNSAVRLSTTKFETNVINELRYKNGLAVPKAMSLEYGGKDRLKYPLLTEVNYGEVAVRIQKSSL